MKETQNFSVLLALGVFALCSPDIKSVYGNVITKADLGEAFLCRLSGKAVSLVRTVSRHGTRVVPSIYRVNFYLGDTCSINVGVDPAEIRNYM